MKFFSLATALLVILYSCDGVSSNVLYETGPGCEYASFFGLKTEGENSDIIIKSSEGKMSQWITLPHNKDYQRIVCMSTSHISYIESLGESKRIIGVSGGQYVSSEYIQSGLSSGRIADIGYEGSLNYELLISIQPDLVLTYGIDGEDNQYIEKIKQFGINVISLGDYLENHPLGKLEYIKLFGKLLNKSEVADSIYNETKDRYIKLKEIVKDVRISNVLINAPWKEVWYIPGKKSYMNILIEDAGGKTLGSSDGSSYTKPYSIEEIFILSAKADVWINPNSISSMLELLSTNSLFSDIPPVRHKKVYNNIKLSTPGGGSQFWERGVVEPDIILKDLISIFHPELLSNYQQKYYLHLD
jgi:iron complex transport system substrate-binding protein